MYQIRKEISTLLQQIKDKESSTKPVRTNSSLEELRNLLKSKDEILLLKDELVIQKDKLIDELSKRIEQLQIHEIDDRITSRKRGTGVADESRTVRPSPPTKHEKPKDISEFLKNAIKNNDFMKRLGDYQIGEITACMEPKNFNKMDVIIKEGENGNHLFVVAEGRVEVSKGDVKQCTLGRGRVFGELALLYNVQRTATVRALMTCKLWCIERESFQKIMMSAGLQTQGRQVAFLKSCENFKNLEDYKLNQMSDALEEVHFRYGDYIIRQGTRGDCFYILSKGKVKVTQTDDVHKSENKIADLKVGDYFGEKALDGDEIRTANVIADDENGVSCFMLERDSYRQVREYVRPSRSGKPGEVKTESIKPERSRPQMEFNIKDIKTVSTLGVGGFGRVELVTIGSDTQKTYALKRMLTQHIVDTKQQQHVCNEREILLSCDSNFICKLYATKKDERFLYFLLEACLGGELWTLLRTKKAFDESTTRFFIACATEALSYLHKQNIVFRDLKPENLILDKKGYVKLVDFGFAKKLGRGEKTWTFCGTPEYIAPEVIQNKGHDTSADLWSLGVLIFELHSGSPPFSYSDHVKTYNAILGGIGNVQFPRYFNRNSERLIKLLCSENPRERLGAGLDGMKNVQDHRWFMGFNWDALRSRTYPSIPVVPNVKGPLDSSNFDDFPPLDLSKFVECRVDTSKWFKDF